MGEVSSFTPPFTPLHIDGVAFPALVTPPESSSKPPLFLAGAGVRGTEIGGKFVKYTAISIYLEESALGVLAEKWAAKSADELIATPEFYTDIINGPFEKFIRVTMISSLTGQQFMGMAGKYTMEHMKAHGLFNEAEVDGLNKFHEVLNPENLPPGRSLLFSFSPSGAFSITFSNDDSVPETNKAVIENLNLCRAFPETILGVHGVSPAAKQSLAIRFCEHFKSLSTAN
ncbi:chalcone--flavanone isomerase-like [Carex rostrata]